MDLTKEERLEKGANHSMVHTDFMVGSDQLNIMGVKRDGSRVDILRKGEWAIEGE